MEAATGDRRRPPVYQGAPAHLAASLRRYFGLHRLLIAKQEVQPSAAAHGDREHRVMGMNCAVLRFDSIFQSSTARWEGGAHLNSNTTFTICCTTKLQTGSSCDGLLLLSDLQSTQCHAHDRSACQTHAKLAALAPGWRRHTARGNIDERRAVPRLTYLLGQADAQ